MSLLMQLKSDIEFAVRARSDLASALLKLVLGDCQLKNDYSDEFIVSVCRRIMENNTKTMNLGGDSVKLSRENELLRSYVPPELSVAELEVHADRISPEIMDAKNEKHAISILRKHLGALGLSANEEATKLTVKRIRDGIKI